MLPVKRYLSSKLSNFFWHLQVNLPANSPYMVLVLSVTDSGQLWSCTGSKEQSWGGEERDDRQTWSNCSLRVSDRWNHSMVSWWMLLLCICLSLLQQSQLLLLIHWPVCLCKLYCVDLMPFLIFAASDYVYVSFWWLTNPGYPRVRSVKRVCCIFVTGWMMRKTLAATCRH